MSDTENTTEQEPQAKSELTERLACAHVGLRTDLEINRHLFRGTTQYVIRDPLTLKCCKLNQKDYTILTYISDNLTLAEIFGKLVKDNILKQEEENGFYRFIVSLHQMTLLNLPVSNDKTLYKRFRARMVARRQEKLLSFFFLRVPLFDPDAFLGKNLKYFGWLFTKGVFAVWLLLMTVGTYIIFSRHEELMAPITQMFEPGNVLFMWFILIALKIIHEFGHGFACKKFGGPVTEMGVFFVIMTPCAYVDVTSSWSFSSKLRRIVVALGGMYFESIIATLALIVWSLSEGTLTQQLAHNVFFLASVVTVLMNINPLMRFDGYYILSDLLEIPNLRQEAQQYAIAVLKKIFLNIKINRPGNSLKYNAFLFLFGVACSVYRIMIVLSISAIIAMKAFAVGIALAGLYISMQIYKVLRQLTAYLWKAQEAEHVRRRAIALNILIISVLPAALLTIPIPGELKVTGQLTRENETIVHNLENGFITEVAATRGELVSRSATIATLQNNEIVNHLIELKTRAEKAMLEFTAAKYQVTDPLLSEQHTALQHAINSELKLCITSYSNLQIKPDSDGIIVDGLNKNDMGRYIKKGTPVATIVSGRWVIKVLVSEQEVSECGITPGQNALFRAAAYPGKSFNGIIADISPQGSKQIDRPALTSLGQGQIPVNPDGSEMTTPHYEVTIIMDQPDNDIFRYGMTGTVKLGNYAKPAGIELIHKMQRFINNLNKE